jgi:DNA-binding GntR family transcriptional regulator
MAYPRKRGGRKVSPPYDGQRVGSAYVSAPATATDRAPIHDLTQRSLEERVYDALRDAIVAGEFRPGDPLVEAQLSQRFGISKTPVREALIRLKRDGLVRAELHRINRVTTPTAQDIRQACEARAWIEAAVTARCAEDPSEELLQALEHSIEQASAALDKDDWRSYGDAVRGFSDALVIASENRYAQDFLDRLRNVLTLIAHVSREVPGRRKRSLDEHRAIYRAIKRRDPVAAADATRIHLASIQRDSLNALTHHAHAGEPRLTRTSA